MVWCNASAESILRRADGLSTRGDRIRPFVPAQEQQLRWLLRQASETTLQRNNSAGGVLSIARSSTARPYQLTISPLSRKADEWGDHATAAIFVIDPENPPEMPLEAFRVFYGLSPAESRLCSLLMMQMSLNEVADALNISINTARTHMKNVLRKCHAGSQSQLLTMLARSVNLRKDPE